MKRLAGLKFFKLNSLIFNISVQYIINYKRENTPNQLILYFMYVYLLYNDALEYTLIQELEMT